MLNRDPIHFQTIPDELTTRTQVQVFLHSQIAQTDATNAKGTEVKTQNPHQGSQR
jgi:hypothetical protein